MSDDERYVVLENARVSTGRGPSALKLLLSAALIFFLGFSGLLTWRWVDRNFFHWGIQDGRTTHVNEAELLRRLQVFQVVSVKDTYQANARVDVSKTLAAGPARIGLPSWVAGENMSVGARVMVAAGVDPGGLGPGDIQVMQDAAGTHVIVTVDSPGILSTEIVPDSMHIDNRQGVLTRLKTTLGIGDEHLADQAADQLSRSARAQAEKNWIAFGSGQRGPGQARGVVPQSRRGQRQPARHLRGKAEAAVPRLASSGRSPRSPLIPP